MEAKEAKVEITKKMKDVMDTVESMTVLELADLVKALEDKFGVTAAAPVAVAAVGAAAGGAAGEQSVRFDAGGGAADESD